MTSRVCARRAVVNDANSRAKSLKGGTLGDSVNHKAFAQRPGLAFRKLFCLGLDVCGLMGLAVFLRA